MDKERQIIEIKEEIEQKILQLRADLKLAELSVEIHTLGIDFLKVLLEEYKEFIRQLDSRTDLTEAQREERGKLLFSRITEDIPRRTAETQANLNYAKAEKKRISEELAKYDPLDTKLPKQ